MVYLIFVFFKQKTAYEMRISDWSSDVCSSDPARPAADPLRQNADGSFIWAKAWPHRRDFDRVRCRRTLDEPGARGGGCRLDWRTVTRLARWASNRSEEHTSELQSLMRISYAVFCLKKKTNTTYDNHHT